MSVYNCWLGISTQAINEFNTFKTAWENDDEYTGPMDLQTAKFMRKIFAAEITENLFKSFDHPNGKTYKLYSLYTDKKEDGDSLQAAVTYVDEEWPQHFEILGVWRWDGRQVGQSYDENGDLTGTPRWPIEFNKVINFMPDVETDPGDPEADPPVPPTYGPATELSDVHLMMGQRPRNFDTE